ncbi:hypothetical protein QWZ13_06950 [Reinekea marina]|uniref:hypothetical protein n=1 Tax=Reinekea marina TaxID=1310421 RepID=UPI0025B28931|nr:hypothetical protein [Reinekea marina]MDN3648649.1 hypothetical protein [Reinekea marina]
MIATSASISADTLMVQISADPNNMHMVDAWTTPRHIAHQQNLSAGYFLRAVAFNNTGGKVSEYVLEDKWSLHALLSDNKKLDFYPPESYILKMKNAEQIEVVKVFRGHINPESDSLFQSLVLSLDSF